MALAVALAALLTLAGTAEAKQRKPCARKGSHTVASTRYVRVYEVRNHDGGHNLYGCLRSSDRRQLLASGYDDNYTSSGSYDDVKIAGRFVAWQFTSTDVSCKAACPPDYDPTTADLHVRDLGARKTANLAGEVPYNGRLVLTRGGALAWTEHTAGEVAVNAFDAAGERSLDHGDISPGSLRLKGRTASWKNAGERRTAKLAPRG